MMGNHHVRFGGGAAEKDGSPYLADALPYTRAVSIYNRTLDRWETTVTTSPRRECTGRLNPRTQQVEVKCR
jgi:hypothetical protein